MFEIGEVWWAKFPFDDNPFDYTIRPVIVLDESTVGVLSVKVTKHGVREYDPYDTPIFYWEEAGLRLASTARVSKTMILDADRFKEKIGDLNNQDLERIIEAYKKFVMENGR